MYKAAYFFCINPDKDHVAPCAVPMVDIEIGSIPESFANPTAQKALAMGLVHTFDNDELSGNQKMDNATASIIGGIDGIVFNDKLKGIYKDRCRQLGEREDIPAFKHKILKDIGGLPIW